LALSGILFIIIILVVVPNFIITTYLPLPNQFNFMTYTLTNGAIASSISPLLLLVL